MIAVGVCYLPDVGSSTFVVVAGLFLLIAGVIVTRWVRTSAGRLSVVVASLALFGGLAFVPLFTDPCSPATTTVPSATTTVPSVTTTVPSASSTVPSATTVPSTSVVGANLTSTTLSITQTWAQEPNGYSRTAAVIVPTSGSGPYPVVIMLHGNGGDSSFINSMGTALNSAIRVAPNGYAKSWNVDNETSKAPDVEFIRDLITLLKTYNNVDAGNISIYGSSNGSGMTNRLLIELDAAAFQKAATRVSQMITKMYHDGSFWFNAAGNNNYDQTITPAIGRKIISISGTVDPIIPYTGGIGAGTTFMDCQESVYRFAQQMGETGPQLSDAAGIPGNGTNGYSAPFVKYTYLNGQVVHYKLIGGDHGLRIGSNTSYATEANQLIATFLLG